MAHEEDEEKETFTSWVLDTLGGVKEEIFDSLVNTGGNTSWVDDIVGTLVNEQEEELNEMRDVNDGGREEEDEGESCAIVTWRCLSQVLGLDTILTMIITITRIILTIRTILITRTILSLSVPSPGF